MKAFGIERYEKAGALTSFEVPEPAMPGRRAVQVQLLATSINPIDRLLAQGYGAPLLNRRRRFPIVLGRDGVGVVTATGPQVNGVRIGQRVILAVSPRTGGTYAERINVPVRCVSPIADALADEEAAGLGYAGSTAVQALAALGMTADRARGQRLVINGATGGVGAIAATLASAWGANVTAVCSKRNHGWARSLGAHETVDYTDPAAMGGIRVDAVLNCAALSSPEDHFRDALSGAVDPLSQRPAYATLLSPLLEFITERGVLRGAVSGLFDYVRRRAQWPRVRYRWVLFGEVPGSLGVIAAFFADRGGPRVTSRRFPIASLPDVFNDAAASRTPGKTCFTM